VSLDFYFTGTFIHILQKDLNGAGRLKTAEAFCPFDDDGRLGVIKYFVEAESFEPSGINALEVDVVDFRAARVFAVLVDQCKRGAGDLIDLLKAEAGGQAAGERGFACPKVAVEEDVCRQRHRLCQFPASPKGFGFGPRDHFS